MSDAIEEAIIDDPINKEIKSRITKLEKRIANCWEMARTYIENLDPHGLHDIGVDIQTLQGAIRELKAVQTCKE